MNLNVVIYGYLWVMMDTGYEKCMVSFYVIFKARPLCIWYLVASLDSSILSIRNTIFAAFPSM